MRAATAVALLLGALAAPPLAGADPISSRTLSVALIVHRDGARLVAHTIKDRPFLGDGASPPAVSGRRTIRLDVMLHGPHGEIAVRHEVEGLCLDHPRETPPHLEGDTIELHEDSVVVELPELPGYDRVSVAHERKALGTSKLDAARLVPASATVHWPEEFGDSDKYRLFGMASEVSRRINIVIVPDGYRYFERGLMEQHAAAMVAGFRAKTPFAEHDRFFNYVLVYAYSDASGTDQCDCGIVVGTAMGTGFPLRTSGCGHQDNRCLYYGGTCDTNGEANLAAAELRAPAVDKTIIMVNTSRYGGCAGSRSVYAAANVEAIDLALHEFGHVFNGLADEYDGTPACASSAGEINTSIHASTGAWPEWIADLGPPWQGAQTYNQCVYRPASICEMRALATPFCPVCSQHMALGVFAHGRVHPTAPILAARPDPSFHVAVGRSTRFDVTTRLAQPSQNQITWRVRGPTDVEPVVVLTGQPVLDYVFPQTGQYDVECEIVADTNFIKPARYAMNRDTALWSVDAAICTGPDTDGDTVADACDNCPTHANTAQGPVVFGQTIVAASSSTFQWPTSADVEWIRGSLAEVSSYDVDQTGTLAGTTTLSASASPAPGNGHYYLLRLAGSCAVRSWQSSLGVEPERDTHLP